MFTFDAPQEKWHVLEGDPTGEARVKLRQWTAGDRLAYQDAVSIRSLTKAEDGSQTARVGVITLIHLASVAVEAVGFGPVTVERDGEKVREEFNPRLEEHLKLLPAETFGELSDAASDFQPLPKAKAKGKGSVTAPPAVAETQPDELALEPHPSDADDPFQAPPTPASASAAPVEAQAPAPAVGPRL